MQGPIVVILAAVLTGCSPDIAQSAASDEGFSRVNYGALPPAVQRKIDEVAYECGAASGQTEGSFAYKLDANSDDHADFIHVPGDGLTEFPAGRSGYCSANWAPVLLWTYDGRGSYNALEIGSDTAVLQSGSEFMFTQDCDENLKFGGLALAVLDRSGREFVAYGRCYESAAAALEAARKRGFEPVSFED